MISLSDANKNSHISIFDAPSSTFLLRAETQAKPFFPSSFTSRIDSAGRAAKVRGGGLGGRWGRLGTQRSTFARTDHLYRGDHTTAWAREGVDARLFSRGWSRDKIASKADETRAVCVCVCV